jgi:hypothetical protein
MTDHAEFQRTWIVKSNGHAFITHYAILLYDLTTILNNKPHIYLEGATHEFVVISLDPNFADLYPNGLVAYSVLDDLSDTIGRNYFVAQEHAYQFKAADNYTAEQMLIFAVADVAYGRLYCDSDFHEMWDVRFPNAVSLRK